MTRAESLLWRYLKANRIDALGFRRQVPIRNYIADAFQPNSSSNSMAGHMTLKKDGSQSRDAFFESEGLQVLRFTNEQVLSNLEGVVEMIRQTAASRICGSPPSLTLPHKGGGNRETGTNDERNIRKTRGQS
jgi:very-short-patch-repair endonuclease